MVLQHWLFFKIIYKVFRRSLNCAWHLMETHVFQVNTFLTFYLVCAKWIFQLISASWGTDVFQVCSFGAAKQIVGSLTAKMCDGEKNSGKDSVNAKWIFSFDPLLLKLLSQMHKYRFFSSSVFQFSFTWLCEKCMCLPSFVKKLAKLTNKLPVYWKCDIYGSWKGSLFVLYSLVWHFRNDLMFHLSAVF